MPKGHVLTDSEIARIKTMSEQRLTQPEIAETVGVSVSTVQRLQKRFSIPASNRYNGGFMSSDETREVPKVDAKPKSQANKNQCGVTVAEKTITFVGQGTQFIYGITGHNLDSIRITTNNEKDVVLDAKDLVSFGNELLDIAEKIMALQKIPW